MRSGVCRIYHVLVLCLCSGCNSTKVGIYIKFSIIPEKKNKVKKTPWAPNGSDTQRGLTQKWKLKVVLKMPDYIYTYKVSMSVVKLEFYFVQEPRCSFPAHWALCRVHRVGGCWLCHPVLDHSCSEEKEEIPAAGTTRWAEISLLLIWRFPALCFSSNGKKIQT